MRRLAFILALTQLGCSSLPRKKPAYAYSVGGAMLLLGAALVVQTATTTRCDPGDEMPTHDEAADDALAGIFCGTGRGMVGFLGGALVASGLLAIGVTLARPADPTPRPTSGSVLPQSP